MAPLFDQTAAVLHFRKGVYECHVSASEPDCLARVDNAPGGALRHRLHPDRKRRLTTYADLSAPTQRFIAQWMYERDAHTNQAYCVHLPLLGLGAAKGVPNDVVLTPPMLRLDPFITPVTRVLSEYHPSRGEAEVFPSCVADLDLPGITYLNQIPFVTSVVECLFGTLPAFLDCEHAPGCRIDHHAH
jgi:hypothetical protein